MIFDIIDISLIEEGERARQEYSKIEELANDISKNGLIQPLAVMKQDSGKYLLLAGGRRLRAIRKNSIEKVPVRVYDTALSVLEQKSIEYSENFHRQDMTWEEQVKLASDIDQLQRQIYGNPVRGSGAGWSTADTAKLLGVDRTTVSRDLAIAKAVQQVPDLFRGCKTKGDAAKVMKKAGKVVSTVIAAEAFQNSMPSSSLAIKKQLVDSYIVGDFFDKIKDIPDESVDLIELDPPYGIDLKKAKQSFYQLYGGYNEIDRAAYPAFLRSLFSECYRVLRRDKWIIVWHSSEWYRAVYKSLSSAGFSPASQIGLWAKPSGVTLRPELYLASTYEPFIYARKGDAVINRQGHSAIFSYSPIPPDRKSHPTERPIELIEDLLLTFTPENSMVLSPFLGSGNTILAAHRSKMKCFGYEIEGTNKDAFIVKVHSL